MNKVLIPTKLSDVAANTLKTAGYEVIQDADTPLEKQVAAHPDAVALIVRSEKVTPEIMDALPSLKLVVRAGAGYDNIDIVYARKKNVDVMNTPGANSNAVAEEVMAMILAYYRHIVQADATTREGLWEKKKYMGSELTKKTVGIIGLGNIGRNLVKRLQGFEPILLGYDHFLARQRALNIGVTPTSIEDIFSQCDIITLHVPGGPSTHHMVNAELIGKMKDGAVLINCSRYGVVDEEALAAAKAAGKNIGYLTDVHPKDAPGEKPSAPIADLILPHLGANTREANTKAAKRAAEQMIAYFSDLLRGERGIPQRPQSGPSSTGVSARLPGAQGRRQQAHPPRGMHFLRQPAHFPQMVYGPHSGRPSAACGKRAHACRRGRIPAGARHRFQSEGTQRRQTL